MFFSPTNVINDGYLDLTAMVKDYGRCELIKMMDQAKKEFGVQLYNEGTFFGRYKSVKVTDKTGTTNKIINIDGEVLPYKDFAVLNCIHEALEVVINL